jgi:hypothetical protein
MAPKFPFHFSHELLALGEKKNLMLNFILV